MKPPRVGSVISTGPQQSPSRVILIIAVIRRAWLSYNWMKRPFDVFEYVYNPRSLSRIHLNQ